MCPGQAPCHGRTAMEFYFVIHGGNFFDADGEGCLQELTVEDQTIILTFFANRTLWGNMLVWEELFQPE